MLKSHVYLIIRILISVGNPVSFDIHYFLLFIYLFILLYNFIYVSQS